jgi:hypothetical protein
MLSLQSGHPWTLVWYKPSCFLEVTSVFHLSILTAKEYTIQISFVKFHIELTHFGWAINAFDACHHQLGILGPLQKMSSAHHDVSQRSHECFIWDCPQLYNIHYYWRVRSFVSNYNSMVVQSMLLMHATTSKASLDPCRKCVVQTMMYRKGHIIASSETSLSYKMFIIYDLCEVPY